MSIVFEQQREEEVRDLVHEVWRLNSRPDLEDDCVEYAYSRYDTIPVYQSVIEFLSSHCGQAMSNQDLEQMHKEALINSNSEEAYKILKQRQENNL
jgi:hypothetical protein|tara:strand:+ start:118 stop:405 length:288 start_codon:yes stop_codon:yes gene_type:complete